MLCPELQELESYVAGGLDEDSSGLLLEHVSGCAVCSEHISDLEQNRDYLSLAREELRNLTAELNEASRLPEVPGYEILKARFKGGQGIVVEALQTGTGRHVAIKFLRSGSLATDIERTRFLREVDIAAALDHPAIATIFEGGATESGALYCVMEWVEGGPLHRSELVRSMGLRERVRLFIAICEGVHHAHQRGVLHRDLKPGNVLVRPDGSPKVVDFGMAKAIDEEEPGSSGPTTRTGEFIGTLAFASPEQLNGERADVRGDVFSLGVLLFYLLTDRTPHPTDLSLAELIKRVLTQDAPLASSLRSDVDRELDTIAEQALRKEPHERYQSVEQLADDLRAWLVGESVQACAGRRLYVIRKTARRHRTALLVAAAFVITLLTATAVSYNAWQDSVRDNRLTLAALDRARVAEQAEQAERMRAEAEAKRKEDMLNFVLESYSKPSLYQGGEGVLAIDALRGVADDIEARFPMDYDIQALVHGALAATFTTLGHDDEFEVHAKKRLELSMEAFGPEAELTLEARNQVIQAGLGGDDLELEGEIESQIERCQRVLGPRHEMTLEARKLAALDLMERGRLTEARELFEEVRADLVEVAGPDSEAVCSILNHLIGLERSSGNFQRAADLTDQIIERRTRAGNADDGLLLSARRARAALLYDAGRWQEAIEEFRSIRELSRGNVTALADLDTNIGAALLSSGREEEAHAVMESARNFMEENGLVDTFVYRRNLGHLGLVCLRLNRPEEALEYAEQALELTEKLDGASPLERHERAMNLGHTYRILGDLERADEHYSSALDLLGAPEIAGPSSVVSTLGWLALTTRGLEGPEAVLVLLVSNFERLTAAGYSSMDRRLRPLAAQIAEEADRLGEAQLAASFRSYLEEG